MLLPQIGGDIPLRRAGTTWPLLREHLFDGMFLVKVRNYFWEGTIVAAGAESAVSAGR